MEMTEPMKKGEVSKELEKKNSKGERQGRSKRVVHHEPAKTRRKTRYGRLKQKDEGEKKKRPCHLRTPCSGTRRRRSNVKMENLTP